MSNTEIPMECKLPIFKRFQEKKYINTKTQEVETKIITRDLMLIKLLKDFSYIDDGFYDIPSLKVYYKGLDLCDWEVAITALYMFSPEYIENDSYYEGKYDTIINVYKRPTSERKAIYDLFQYLDDSETKSQSEKIVFDYEKFRQEYIEIRKTKTTKKRDANTASLSVIRTLLSIKVFGF